MDLNQKLSENFSLREFVKSDTAVRLGIDNTPTEEQVQKLKDLCENVIQPARNHFGSIRINSGYRCVELCEAVGSNGHSNHAYALAGDIEANDPNISNFKLLLWIYENCEFKELIAEFFDNEDPKGGWVHVAYEKGNNKRELKLKDKTHNYTHVTIDELKSLYKA